MFFVDVLKKKIELQKKIKEKEKKLKEYKTKREQYYNLEQKLINIKYYLQLAKDNSKDSYNFLKQSVKVKTSSSYDKCEKVHNDITSLKKTIDNQIFPHVEKELKSLRTKVNNTITEISRLKKQLNSL